ncbi:PadR family transcriptional regulator [Cellulomonas bogoriensis]|uniref:PadR family transcriptional regulator n=1 Tax=Cellulomonas bogoriensis 69B4 = DSM 16987 TaxID=1386082 RepID=A0A0A0BSN5_9CELL|nr:PadR family transcriptional regulator [Cellulomonas bogoriensis]KGM10667.1 PadR family transcriptional regulator [Cellulomonas bogoriensis 69B4 = DSM 16987]
MAQEPQLLKGILPMLVLATLTEGPSYGYELVTRLRTSGLPGLTAGTLYPVLARLERDQLLTTRLVPSPSGPARKYYEVTAAGDARLQRAVLDWHELSATVARVLAPRAHPADPAHLTHPPKDDTP